MDRTTRKKIADQPYKHKKLYYIKSTLSFLKVCCYVNYLLPPTNGVAKDMFSIVSVCLSTGGSLCKALGPLTPSDLFNQLGPHCTGTSPDMPKLVSSLRNL